MVVNTTMRRMLKKRTPKHIKQVIIRETCRSWLWRVVDLQDLTG
jgi:hypothetical protein